MKKRPVASNRLINAIAHKNASTCRPLKKIITVSKTKLHGLHGVRFKDKRLFCSLQKKAIIQYVHNTSPPNSKPEVEFLEKFVKLVATR